MRHQFRPYGKKRGQRRTGSKQLGRVGEVLFFLFFLAAGTAGLSYLLATYIWPEWKMMRHYVQHEGVVLGTRVASRWPESPSGIANRIQDSPDHPEQTAYRPEVHIRYVVGGRTFDRWTYDVHGFYSPGRVEKQSLLAAFRRGERHICWYDPADPKRVVVVRRYTWWMWVLLILPASLLILGGIGVTRAVLQSITSMERRASFAQQAARLTPAQPPGDAHVEFPTVPSEHTLTDSPGTDLAYRLPAESNSQWVLWGMFTLCLFWNATVAWVTWEVSRQIRDGEAASAALLVVLPFAAVGAGLAYHCLRSVYRATAIGTTRVEISSHPLHPGRTYHMLLSQSGRLRVSRLEALLTCHEEATYRQGTDTRTARRCVHELSVYRRFDVELRRAVPFAEACRIVIPAPAMHSFQSAHNEVQWEIVVRATVAGWPTRERRFPLVVYPGSHYPDMDALNKDRVPGER